MKPAEPRYVPSLVTLAVVAIYATVAMVARWSPDQERLLSVLVVTTGCFIWLCASRTYWSLWIIATFLGILLGHIAYPILRGTADHRAWLPAIMGLLLAGLFLSRPFRILARHRDEASRPTWMGGLPPSA